MKMRLHEEMLASNQEKGSQHPNHSIFNKSDKTEKRQCVDYSQPFIKHKMLT